MAKDRLYLLPLGFDENDGTWVCHDCTAMEGYLHQHPHLRDAIEVVYVPFPKPRAIMVELLGEDHQGLPCLILAEPRDGPDVLQANGRGFIDTSRGIMRYLAARYGSHPPRP